MTDACHWPGCKVEGRAWCEEHYRMLPGHLRAAIARGDDHADRDAIGWVRSTFDPSSRERWDPGKWGEARAVRAGPRRGSCAPARVRGDTFRRRGPTMISEARKELLRVAWMRSRSERPWGLGLNGKICDATCQVIGAMTSVADADLVIAAVNVLPLFTLPPEADREMDGGRVAELAATIAAGTEAGVQLTPAPPDGREPWGSAEDVARRAVAIARAILAEVREP